MRNVAPKNPNPGFWVIADAVRKHPVFEISSRRCPAKYRDGRGGDRGTLWRECKRDNRSRSIGLAGFLGYKEDLILSETQFLHPFFACFILLYPFSAPGILDVQTKFLFDKIRTFLRS